MEGLAVVKIDETEFRVRYQETDKMGIVYYGNYLAWFEQGRTEWMRRNGISYRELEASGIFLPVTECHCQYLSSVTYDDVVRVQTWVGNLTGARIEFRYNIVVPGGRVVATGYTKHGFVDAQGKPIPLKKRNPDVWRVLDAAREDGVGGQHKAEMGK